MRNSLETVVNRSRRCSTIGEDSLSLSSCRYTDVPDEPSVASGGSQGPHSLFPNLRLAQVLAVTGLSDLTESSIHDDEKPEKKSSISSVTRRVSDAFVRTLQSIRNPSIAALEQVVKLGAEAPVDLSRFEVEEIILRAHRLPDPSSVSLEETLSALKRKKYMDRQFVQIQNQTGINYTTLKFSPQYEPGFCSHIYARAAKRVRYCMLFGVCLLISSYMWNVNLNGNVQLIVSVVRFGLVIPSMLLLIYVTFKPKLVRYIELLTSSVILFMAFSMVFEKMMAQSSMPLIPLFILLVPVFGITRMRFLTSVIVGITILIMFVLGSLASGTSARSAVMFQSANYLTALLVGMVSHYRQEVLRRRNYALCLPLLSRGVQDVSAHLQSSDKFRKRNLLETFSLRFKDTAVEEIFYRYWYLIDPFPFEHTSSAVLHEGVFKAIQYAVGGAVLSQVALSIQDVKFMCYSSPSYLPEFRAATGLRYGVIIPGYLLALLAMYFFGRRYVRIWRRNSPRERLMEKELGGESIMDVNLSPRSMAEEETALTLQLSYGRAQVMSHSPNYVRTMQRMSTMIVAAHGFAAAAILFIVSMKVNEAAVANTYLMGLLNALLFAHRSGFRLRFWYASMATLILFFWFVSVVWFYLPSYAVLYTTYLATILFFGMLISYEEESLRRKFFVLRSLRMLEFSEWYRDIHCLKSWVRERLRVKAKQARERLRARNGGAASFAGPPEPGYACDAAKMGEASKYGMIVMGLNVVIGVAGDLLSGVAGS